MPPIRAIIIVETLALWYTALSLRADIFPWYLPDQPESMDRARANQKRGNVQHKAVSMGKYKQWLHHQEVGARLRDEIAAHEAERERVLKLAPTRQTSLPDVSNPLIAALLGQTLVTQATKQQAEKAGANGASGSSGAAEVKTPAKAEAETSAAGSAGASPAPAKEAGVISTAAPVRATTQVLDETPASQEENKTLKGAKPKVVTTAGVAKDKPASDSAPSEPEPVSAKASQPDTIDPLLAQLLAQAENAPGDPLEALNLLASQGPDLTRGEAPQPMVSLPTSPFTSPPPAGQSAISALMGEAPKAPEAKAVVTEPLSTPVAVGVEAVSTSTEGTLKAEKGRSDTDELVAARPTEGYTEPRLIVPQWLKSMELGQESEGEKAGEGDDAESKQRFSVSLPFENEEDMRLHESVERWWQRWRQQS